jgi:hypothetical protein
MGGGILIDPVRLFVRHPMAANNLSCGARLVDRAGERSVAKRFRPVSPRAGVPVVNDDLHRHRTTPDTALALRVVRRRRQTPMTPVTVNRQRGRHAVPGCCGNRFWFAPRGSQLAGFVDVRNFESRIRHPMPHSFDRITDLELVFRVGCRADADPEYAAYPANDSFDSQYETEIRVASFIERTCQTNSRLDPRHGSRPIDLVAHPGCVHFKPPLAFDRGLHNAGAIDGIRDSSENFGVASEVAPPLLSGFGRSCNSTENREA